MGLFKKIEAGAGVVKAAAGGIGSEGSDFAYPVTELPRTGGCSACVGAVLSSALEYKRQVKRAEREAGA